MQGRRSSTVAVSCPAESGEEQDFSISSDDDLSPIPQPKPKPGAITPLGIRHDKSKGPLGHQTASTTIDEMDTALARLNSWRSRHEHQMAALRREGLNSMEDNRPSTPELGSMDKAAWSLERPRSAAPRIVADDPTTSTSSRFSAQMESLNPVLVERPSTALPSCSRPSSSFSRSTRLGQDELDLLRHSMTLDFRSPMARRGGTTSSQSLSRPATSSGTSTSSVERSRMSHPRPPASEDISRRQPEATIPEGAISEVPAGSRLMAELEAELADLDRGLEESELMTWESELEEVLAKMDTLQTGYQVVQVPSNKRQ